VAISDLIIPCPCRRISAVTVLLQSGPSLPAIPTLQCIYVRADATPETQRLTARRPPRL